MLKSVNLKKIGRDAAQLNGPLLIDGMAACYRLYRELDWKNGGQYKELEHKCIDFVTNLHQSNIEPIFVFDGVDYKGENEPTLVRRKTTVEKISSYLLTGHNTDCSCIPIFARIVMSEVLREMKVAFIVADGDADSLTASIANYYKCPVLSNDSDFFIFNIEGGYIPFESFNFKFRHITGNIYKWTNFASTFRNPDIVYLIPALASNDFISEGAQDDVMASINKISLSGIFGIGGRSNKISDLVNHIRSFSSVEEFFLSCSCEAESIAIIRENFHKAKEMYTVDKISMEDAMKSTELETAIGTPLPSWILEQYRTGCFSTSVMDPIILNKCVWLPITIDNPKKESSMKIGVPLRRHLYGLLNPYLKVQKIKEVMRVGNDMQYISVGPIKLEREGLDQLEMLCEIFGVLPDELDQFENKWKLVALSLHYWSRNAEALTQRQVDSLLFCFVICSSEEGRYIARELISQCHFLGRRQFTDHQLDSLHSFSMWQCVYYEAMKLNDFLKRPLDFTSPAVMFDGKICMFCAGLKESEFDKVSMMVTGSSLKSLYKKLMNICKMPLSNN